MTTIVDSRRETVSLIGSDKVEGTAVYGADDQKIGTVQRVMLDKVSGKVAYAVVSFGGFLGMGEDYYPMPWPNMKYATNLGGYRVGITENQLKGAPKYNRSTDWDWSNRARDQEVYDYYHTPLWY
jgi:PRC-barrel domain